MEILDIYNNKGEVTGKTVDRYDEEYVFAENEYMAIAQIYIENNAGYYLIEESAKKTGNRFLPVGGHIAHGETPYETIVREVLEEIGLDISKEDIADLGFIVDDSRVRFIYYLKKDVDISTLTIQPEEVKSVKYMTVDEIKDYIEKGLMHPSHNILVKMVLDYKNR